MSSVEPLPSNPWLSMWFSPRATMGRIAAHDPEAMVFFLASIGGISGLVDHAAERHLGDQLGWPVIVLLAVIFGPVTGVLGVYFSGWLLRLTGRWIGGRGTPEGVRAAIAWSNLPTLAVLLLRIPEIALFGQDLFTRTAPAISQSLGLRMILSGFVLAQGGLALWALVLLVLGLSAVHRFSAWRALGNLALAGLVLSIPVIVVMLRLRLSG